MPEPIARIVPLDLIEKTPAYWERMRKRAAAIDPARMVPLTDLASEVTPCETKIVFAKPRAK